MTKDKGPRTKDKPKQAGRRIAALLQRAGEPLIVFDAARLVVFANKAWEELTGQTAESVVGRECSAGPANTSDGESPSLAHFNPPPEAWDGRPQSARALVPLADGTHAWRRLECQPLSTRDGRLLGLLCWVRPADAPAYAPESPARRLRAELLELRQNLMPRAGPDALIGRGPAHRRLLQQIDAAVRAEGAVLIVGEPGSGRRLIARIVHERGPAPQAPFLCLDAAALPADALERAMFPPTEPDENGDSISGDWKSGTTLVIGDLSDVPRDVQARLAALLEGPTSRTWRPIFTTASEPETLLRSERLRPDLYYAATAHVLRVAPLRERLDELPLLAQHFVERHAARVGCRAQGLSPEAVDVLCGYDWPGNLRELTRVVEAACERCEGDLISAADLPSGLRGHLASAYNPPPMPPPVAPLDGTLEQVERRLIEQALQWSRHNKSRAAELLSISRPRLYRRMKDLAIPDLPEEA